MLKGKKALVTGGSRGIGRAIALALAGEGADVALTYFRREKAARETAVAIEALGQKAHLFQANLAYTEQIDRLFVQIEQQLGHLDIFISNAASATFKPLRELPVRHWDYVMNVNLRAFFLCGVQSARLMTGRNGRIIGISSVGSRRALPGYAALGVAKAGMEALARYMAVEWAGADINVNIICGGPIETEALAAYIASSDDPVAFKSSLAERTPTGRTGCPKDLTGLVLYLCSPAADWIRGQTLVADGGYSLL